ncbi:MAG: tRNA (N(6)-L-threonylcarbamoyladenosine(37)-C(2))-methylthiotransferase MtaB [Chloroflexota bacterium]|nr:tRNA (N(6)-L-threonylcarbamoyladenosine(37)-C(2))-methylthiotransferase MtaB [Chloroflexota bacterium]
MGNRVAVETLGCRLNQAESESLARELSACGYRVVHAADGADVYVLNTCTVTHVADRKSRHLLRLARRRNPRALVIAIGCYPQRAMKELDGLEAVDVVLDNDRKGAILEVIKDRCENGSDQGVGPSPVLRTRSMVKVQEGCNQFCTYCIVPYVRGGERSLPPDQVVREVAERAKEGYREATLTGTEIGAYEPGLATVVQRVLAESGIERLRLSSIRPRDLTPELLSLWNDVRLCPHVHIPLQSGSDTVLQRMGRPYSAAEYADAVALVREAVPRVSVSTDVLVGFPGETGEEFEESFAFCRAMGFGGIHVFTYSERPGTVAAGMGHKVAESQKALRSKRMLELAKESVHRYRRRYLGHEAAVLWEREVGNGVWTGYTDNYVRVFTRSDQPLHNAVTVARLTGWRGEDLWATPSVSSSCR